MEYCPKCGAKLIPTIFWVDGEKQHMKVWEYGKGWRTIERRKTVIELACPKCGCKSGETEPKRSSVPKREPAPVVRAKTAPLPDMPLSRRRYYPSYMSGNEWFRDEMRQADVVESITRVRVPAKQTEKKERNQQEKKAEDH